MAEHNEEETKSGFLFRNLLRGLVWFAVIIFAFIYLEDFILENFKSDIEALQRNPIGLLVLFFVSEVVFGLVPPEFFMMVWILSKISLSGYIINLAILSVLSYIAGIIGFYIGRNFSKTKLYKKLFGKYLIQYKRQLKRYGGFLVFVGAVTPLPYSATCMLAGSVNLSTRDFLLIGIARVIRFAVYGWMVWSFPNIITL
jgi:membrane protein YqaA with SNARE-associated domain